jgi:EAL and modified HD-GYP domain-containing signal transduction protein
MKQSSTNQSKLPIRLSASDLQAIRDALRILPVTKPRLSVESLTALKAFLQAQPGYFFEVTMVDLETACQALASLAQSATGSQRQSIDETLARATAALLKPGSLFAGPAASDSGSDSNDILINRRPVVDRNVKVHAYEPSVNAKMKGAGRNGTVTVSNNPGAVFAAICENLDNIAGDSSVLMSLPYEAIPAKTYEALPKERVILRLEDCGSQEQNSKSMAKLFSEGYRLALSDSSEDLNFAAGLAKIIYLDFRRLGRQALPKRVAELQRFRLKLLVDNIDTYEDFEFCKALGLDLFQGRFFLKPDSRSRNVPLSRTAVVELMAALQDPDIRLRDIEHIIGRDVSLSYNLLRFANSAFVGLRRSVESISHAVGLVGMERIQTWASLILFSTIEEKPRELVTTAAIRAKMCEQLADSDDRHRKAMLFTVGLLSVLDAILDEPMAKAVSGLPLAPEIHDALVDHRGTLGRTLEAVLAYEHSDWNDPQLARFDKPALRDSYLESLGWWRSISNSLLVQHG